MITVKAARDVAFDDVEHALTGGGDGASCACQWFTMRAKDFSASSRDERWELLRREVAERSAGLVAYEDGVAAGWVRVGRRSDQIRLLGTRVVKMGSTEPPGATDVWGITCLVVRREFRGREITHALIEAAVAHAGANGARVIEAYPVDTDEHAKVSSNELFVGSVRMFGKAGFEVIARPPGRRTVMTRAVAR
jgi:GNAT superfamily N-acetyltransferase